MPELPKFEQGDSKQEHLKKQQGKKETAPTQAPVKKLKSVTAQKAQEFLQDHVVTSRSDGVKGFEIRSAFETKKVGSSVAGASELSDYERWNNLCAAAAEDVLLDDAPPIDPKEIDRTRKHITQLVELHRRRR
jgi:hypothetical protein